MDIVSDAGSEWSQVTGEDVITREAVLSLIAAMQAEHTKQQQLLRNQMKVMAAFSRHPQGACVHSAARLMQAAIRSRAARRDAAATHIARMWKGHEARKVLDLSIVRRAAVRMQAAQRRHVQVDKFKSLLAAFPDRSKAKLIEAAKQAQTESKKMLKQLNTLAGLLPRLRRTRGVL